ncbi:hypothetical protein PIB30_023682 [Stylosanthes scabra]|uniref:Uncharacterized protein n=1 Tax=Stylosanthes scabra TaxID=79078 RepID=A0ABU6T9A1_9FABA|nr:hypothetical protein [Stylosanthes scabra]
MYQIILTGKQNQGKSKGKTSKVKAHKLQLRARKSKSKKPKVANVSQAEKIIFSQSAPILEPLVPHLAPPVPPAQFRKKQPIVRPHPTTNAPNSKKSQLFAFMPTPGFRHPNKF